MLIFRLQVTILSFLNVWKTYKYPSVLFGNQSTVFLKIYIHIIPHIFYYQFVWTNDSSHVKWSAGTETVEYKGNSWHDECFTCYGCKQPIGSQSFLSKGTDVYCSPCYDKKFAKLCFGCKKVCSSSKTAAFLYITIFYKQERKTDNLKVMW